MHTSNMHTSDMHTSNMHLSAAILTVMVIVTRTKRIVMKLLANYDCDDDYNMMIWVKLMQMMIVPMTML